jgi:hypothetical protein
MLTNNLVVNGAVSQRDLDHIATSGLHGLLNRYWHLFCFTLAHTDSAVPVANDSQRSETKRSATLHHFSYAIHRDHFFLETVVITFGLGPSLKLCHF